MTIKVLLCQWGISPNLMPQVCGWTRKVYGRAIYNVAEKRHEFAMPLDDYLKAAPDIGRNMGRPGGNWLAIPVVIEEPKQPETVDGLTAEQEQKLVADALHAVQVTKAPAEPALAPTEAPPAEGAEDVTLADSAAAVEQVEIPAMAAKRRRGRPPKKAEPALATA